MKSIRVLMVSTFMMMTLTITDTFAFGMPILPKGTVEGSSCNVMNDPSQKGVASCSIGTDGEQVCLCKLTEKQIKKLKKKQKKEKKGS